MFLYIEIQRKFVRSRAQANRIKFHLAFVGNICLEEIRSEYIALEQEFMVGFERAEHFAQ